MDLIDFAEEYQESPDFSYLRDRISPYIPGRGAEQPTVMLLGDAPSATENNERKPLAGQPGRVLDQLMGLAGLRFANDMDKLTLKPLKANAYVTNMIKHWVGVRGLTNSEIEKATPWVKREWTVLGCPPVIIPLGLRPMRCLLGIHVKLSDVVGSPCPIAAGGPVVWPMLHPTYPMHEPRMRPVSEAHWQALGAWLKEEGLV